MAHKSLNPAASLKTFFDFVFFSRSKPSDFETRDAAAAVEKGLLSFFTGRAISGRRTKKPKNGDALLDQGRLILIKQNKTLQERK